MSQLGYVRSGQLPVHGLEWENFSLVLQAKLEQEEGGGN
jgi:hypothetical protein